MFNIEKKHSFQMTSKEIKRIYSRFSEIKNFSMANHCLRRMKEKHINKDEMINTLQDFDIVEFNTHKGDKRVLIRSRKAYNGCNICMSISLVTGLIITVYKNDRLDSHFTLDINNYTKDIDIVTLIDQIGEEKGMFIPVDKAITLGGI